MIIEITQEELTREHNRARSDKEKTVRINEEEHTQFKTYASSQGISVKALINCIASKLPKTQ